MSNIAAVLRQEIIRLARKEAKALSQPLKKASGQYRKDIANLKRQISKASAEIGRLLRQASKGGAAPVAEAPAETIRYSAASVRAQRKRLGLSAVDFSALLGVAAPTVLKWERGTSRPRTAQVKSFAAVRGLGKTEANARLLELRAKAKGRKKSK